MYSCVMNETNNGAVVLKDEVEMGKVSIRFINNKAYVDVTYVDRNLLDHSSSDIPLVKFASTICKKVEEALLNKEIKVDKVVFGTFAEIDKLDEHLEQLKTIVDEETYNKIKGKSPNKR